MTPWRVTKRKKSIKASLENHLFRNMAICGERKKFSNMPISLKFFFSLFLRFIFSANYSLFDVTTWPDNIIKPERLLYHVVYERGSSERLDPYDLP